MSTVIDRHGRAHEIAQLSLSQVARLEKKLGGPFLGKLSDQTPAEVWIMIMSMATGLSEKDAGELFTLDTVFEAAPTALRRGNAPRPNRN